jgi:hypothetical protein
VSIWRRRNGAYIACAAERWEESTLTHGIAVCGGDGGHERDTHGGCGALVERNCDLEGSAVGDIRFRDGITRLG